jgi:hypothetical protein
MQPRRFEFEDEIWSLRPELGGGRWAVQTRNADRRTSSFFLAEESGNIKPFNGPREDSWWTELTAFHPEVLLVAFYQDGSLPVLDGLMGFSTESGDLLWRRPGCSFQGLSHESVIANVILEQEIISLDIRSGEKIEGIVSEIEPQPMLFPKWMASEEGKQIAFLEHRGFELVAWHEQGLDGHDLFLEFGPLNAQGTRICLEKGMKKLHPEPFMVHGHQVVAIQDRKQLLLIDLP